MVESFYDIMIPELENTELDNKWTPAEVNQILFRNFKNSVKAIEELAGLTRDDLYGFAKK